MKLVLKRVSKHVRLVTLNRRADEEDWTATSDDDFSVGNFGAHFSVANSEHDFTTMNSPLFLDRISDRNPAVIEVSVLQQSFGATSVSPQESFR